MATLYQLYSYYTIKFDMNKSTNYLGEPVLSQLLSLIDNSIIKKAIVEHKANYCYKKLFVWDHFVSMLHGVYSHCTSLRELQCELEVCQGKLNHLNLSRVPSRSTLSDGFSKMATLLRLHIMKHVALSAIIEANKIKRKRYKKNAPINTPPIIYQHLALQTKMEM